jgi:hypothetical protein
VALLIPRFVLVMSCMYSTVRGTAAASMGRRTREKNLQQNVSF